jgi:hypothetical protein
VLDQDLRVVAASRSFYRTFKVSPKDTEGKLLYLRALFGSRYAARSRINVRQSSVT